VAKLKKNIAKIEEPKVEIPTVESAKSKVKALANTVNYRTKPLHLSSDWSMFLGELPSNAQWTILVYGPSHGGKSSFVMKFAQELANNGKLLYINAEESLEGGTLQSKLRRLNITSPKIFFYDDDDIEGIRKELSKGIYQFVIFDSLSKVAKANKQSVLDVFNWHKEFPKINFIYVLFTTKDGKAYKGDSDLKFLAEIAIEVRNGIADCSEKNRYKQTRKNMQFEIF